MTVQEKCLLSPAQSILQVLDGIATAAYTGPGTVQDAFELMEHIIEGSSWDALDVLLLDAALRKARSALRESQHASPFYVGPSLSDKGSHILDHVDVSVPNAHQNEPPVQVGKGPENPFMKRFGLT